MMHALIDAARDMTDGRIQRLEDDSGVVKIETCARNQKGWAHECTELAFEN
jgi:hypothetical protein